MKAVRITTLYRYDLLDLTSYKLEKYKLKTGDIVTVEVGNGYSVYRCRNQGLDFSGFPTLKEAREEYQQAVIREIWQLQDILKTKFKKG